MVLGVCFTLGWAYLDGSFASLSWAHSCINGQLVVSGLIHVTGTWLLDETVGVTGPLVCHHSVG